MTLIPKTLIHIKRTGIPHSYEVEGELTTSVGKSLTLADELDARINIVRDNVTKHRLLRGGLDMVFSLGCKRFNKLLDLLVPECTVEVVFDEADTTSSILDILIRFED